MNPKVSVIIPVYNASKYLAQCLDTLLLQTLQDIEVICIDDGSTDDSLSILNSYAQLDERLKVICQENQGAGPARNRGIQEAKGDFLSFLDADDFFQSNMLETLYYKAIEDRSDVVICGYTVFDEQQQRDVNQIIPTALAVHSPAAPSKFGNEIFNFSGSVWNKFFRRSLVEKNGLQFDNLPACNDVNFGCTALALSRIVSVVPDCFVHYRLNLSDQISASRGQHPETAPYALNNIWHNLKKFNLEDVFRTAFLRRVQKMLTYHLSCCNEQQKETFLVTLKSYLDPEIYEAFFGTAPIKVSVIIPVYNTEKYISQCLDSVICQTLSDIEIICVNDGSTDNSLEILQKYAAQDKRIKVLNQENQKQSIARANAMEIATGEYIQFVDADDCLTETCCECLWLYSKIKDTDMLSFGSTCFDEDTQEIVDNPYYNFTYLPPDFDAVFTPRMNPNIMVQMAVTAWMTFYKHSFLKANKLSWLRKPLFYEDTYFFTKAILKADKVSIFRNKFYFRRYHSQCTVRQVKNFADYHKIIYLTLKYVHDHESNAIFLLFLNYYITKLLTIYNTLTPSQKVFYAKDSYKLAKNIFKHIRIRLNPEFEKVAETYALTALPLCKFLKLKLYKAFAALNNPRLSFSLFELTRSPLFSLRIFEIPVITCQNDIEADRKNIFLLGIPFFQRRFQRIKSEFEKQQPQQKNSVVCSKEATQTKDFKKKVVVSLTSYSARIKDVSLTIKSLLNQTIKPDKIVLYLGKDKCSPEDIPQDLSNLTNETFEIHWIEKDFGSFMKLVPALEEFPEEIIITADDDIIYQNTWLEKLLKAHQLYPNDIVCHRAHRILFQKGSILPYRHWINSVEAKDASYSNFLTGVGGVLYPPKCLHKDVTRKDLFLKLCPKADDIWFWAMAVKKGTKIRVVEDPQIVLDYIPASQNITLQDENYYQDGNVLQLDAVFEHYPDILRRVKNEYLAFEKVYLFNFHIYTRYKKAKNISYF